MMIFLYVVLSFVSSASNAIIANHVDGVGDISNMQHMSTIPDSAGHNNVEYDDEDLYNVDYSGPGDVGYNQDINNKDFSYSGHGNDEYIISGNEYIIDADGSGDSGSGDYEISEDYVTVRHSFDIDTLDSEEKEMYFEEIKPNEETHDKNSLFGTESEEKLSYFDLEDENVLMYALIGFTSACFSCLAFIITNFLCRNKKCINWNLYKTSQRAHV